MRLLARVLALQIRILKSGAIQPGVGEMGTAQICLAEIRSGQVGVLQNKRESEAALRSAIETVIAEWPTYGYRRVTHELRRRGIVVNHKRIARIMREEALTPRRVRRFLATTDSDHVDPIYENLASGLRPCGPNELLVADITYIRLRSGFVYLAVLLDAWSRPVVGYAVGNALSVAPDTT